MLDNNIIYHAFVMNANKDTLVLPDHYSLAGAYMLVREYIPKHQWSLKDPVLAVMEAVEKHSFPMEDIYFEQFLQILQTLCPQVITSDYIPNGTLSLFQFLDIGLESNDTEPKKYLTRNSFTKHLNDIVPFVPDWICYHIYRQMTELDSLECIADPLPELVSYRRFKTFITSNSSK